MKAELLNKIIERAKNKKDGVYSYQHTAYSVKSGYVGFVGAGGEIYQFVYGFLAVIGTYKYQSEARDKIKQLTRQP